MTVNLLSGEEVEAQTGYPTDGKTYYLENDSRPLISVGRVCGSEGVHVLKTEKGGHVTQSGYRLFDEPNQLHENLF